MAGPNACNSIRSRLSQLASALFVAKIHRIFKKASHETQDASFDAPRRLDLERDDVLPSAAGNAGWTFNTEWNKHWKNMLAVVSLVIEIVISQVQDQRAIGHIGWICTRDHLKMQSI